MNPDSVRHVTDIVQVVNLVLALLILALSIVAARRWKAARLYAVGPVTFAVHSIIFYAVTMMGLVVTPWTSLWSATLRLHGYVFLLGTLGVLFAVALSPEWDDHE